MICGNDELCPVCGTNDEVIVSYADHQQTIQELHDKLHKEVADAHDAWVQSGHQKHARAVARHMAKVYARITGKEFVR